MSNNVALAPTWADYELLPQVRPFVLEALHWKRYVGNPLGLLVGVLQNRKIAGLIGSYGLACVTSLEGSAHVFSHDSVFCPCVLGILLD